MKVKLALAQFSMSDSYEDNIRKADVFLNIASKIHADLLLLPELFERRYFCQVENYDYFSFAEERDNSPTLKHFQEMAKRYRLVIPVSFFEKCGNTYFNSIVVFDKDGADLGIYRKSHIPTGECYEEKFYFSNGDTGFKVFNSSIGRIGIGICWDQWFPETARILALKGADFLLFPTAIGSEPVLDKDSETHWENVMKGHAAANIMPLLAANRIGLEKEKNSEMRFFGSSFIANQHGDFVGHLKRDEENLLFADFDLDAIKKERVDWGVFRDRRVDLYSPILKMDDSK